MQMHVLSVKRGVAFIAGFLLVMGAAQSAFAAGTTAGPRA